MRPGASGNTLYGIIRQKTRRRYMIRIGPHRIMLGRCSCASTMEFLRDRDESGMLELRVSLSRLEKMRYVSIDRGIPVL